MARAGGVSSCCIVVRIGSVPEVTAGPNEFVDATLGYTRYSPRHAAAAGAVRFGRQRP
jgi:hypothetical protein